MRQVPLHLTKVAFQVPHLDHLRARIAERGAEADGMVITTRYLPKRADEIVGGSLFWILKHQLVGRSLILGFGEAEGGRIAIRLGPELILVQPRAKRAHQGWRYLEDANAPRDLTGAAEGIAEMPTAMIGKLTALALL